MLTCSDPACPSNGPDDPGAGFERREYVRQETIVDRNDEPKDDEGIITDPPGAERTYRCLSCGGHDVHDR